MIKSIHVSLGSASVGCRHLEWLPVPETVSHVCPSRPVLVSDERELLVASVFGVSTLRVAVLREGWKNFSTLRVSKTFTLLAVKGFNWLSTATGEPVSGKFVPC